VLIEKVEAMRPFGLITIFIILYSIIWVDIIIGITLIRKKNKYAEKMHKLFLNKQIQKFRYPPFKDLLKLWIAKKFLLTSITFILIIIIPVVFLYFLLGIILITPLLSIIQGLTVGILIGYFDRKHMYWAVIVGMFEFGYWALSGALGIYVATGFLLNDMSFIESLLNGVDILFSGYWIPIAICILVNAFGEVAGPIYWDMKSPISLEVLSQGTYINDDT